MSWMTPEQRRVARAVGELAHVNPFSRERVKLERGVLGDDFVDAGESWHLGTDPEAPANPNVLGINARVAELASTLRDTLAGGARPTRREAEIWSDLCDYVLYYAYQGQLKTLIVNPDEVGAAAPIYERFRADFAGMLQLPGLPPQEEGDIAHLFASCFQVRRAFHFIFRGILGSSPAIATLRQSVWESTFTHDFRRYRRALERRLSDLTTLVLGPSGTGKELVAQAIGMARPIPFDPGAGRFVEDFRASFIPIHLAAFSPTLIESELFGQRRGAFTGAVSDRAGWLERCPPLGTVFLDEIGEVEPTIQVKLLRVLQTRTFHRLGDHEERRFHGRIVAATNRAPEEEMRAGRLREDFYYRLCSDIVRTPSLKEQLGGDLEHLEPLLGHLARGVAGDEEGPALAARTRAWIEKRLGGAYEWPGNVRELEQCVRNVLIRGRYEPRLAERDDQRGDLAADMLAGRLSADELVAGYLRLLYERTGSYVETGRIAGLDRRTVKAKIAAETPP